MFSAKIPRANEQTEQRMPLRTEKGISLIEMLITMFIMGFVAAATCEIFAALNLVSFKANSQFNSILSERRLLSILAPQIRSSISIGNQYKTTIDAFAGFPSQDSTSQDPYRPGNSPPQAFKGWPTSTGRSTWPNPPYMLNGQTLILQIPIRGSGANGGMNGIPQIDSARNKYAVDTYVYKVLADNLNPGKGMFVIERAYFPGPRTNLCNAADSIASNQPQTVLTGIVGPIDLSLPTDPIAGTAPPQIFTYLVPTLPNPPIYNTTTPEVDPKFNSFDLPYSGVGISCEIVDSSSTNIKVTNKSTAIRNEFYKRSSPIGAN